MSSLTAMANLMPKSTLFNMVQKSFTQKAGFEVTEANIFINYVSGKFKLKVKNKELKKFAEKEKPVSEFDEMNGFLLAKVKKHVKADEIDVIDLDIDFKSRTSIAKVYYRSEKGEKNLYEIDDLF